ncbi:MAG: virulence protein SciE type [Pirellulaceae bacterium]|nr:virulence protein SciE type [Pirellulaceae bacterium]
MKSVQLLKSGDLVGALKGLQAEIRDAPQVAKHRIFLFQLLCALGQWDRALTQLNVLRDIDPSALSMVQAYQEALNCEALRKSVFAGERSPLILGEPEPWMAMMVEALKLSVSAPEEADLLRSQALEQATVASGVITLFPTSSQETRYEEKFDFQWVADADSRIGPFLEAIVNGKYFWIPATRLQSVAFEKVADLRDLVWLPCRFQWSNGGEAVGFVPTRYAGSESVEDDEIRLARKTQWQETSPGVYAGLGLRMLTTDADEFGLTQIAKIDFIENAASESTSSDSEAM